MPKTIGRRDLSFASLNEVMPDVERLLAGHETVGKWSLGQMCNHLAATLIYSVEGMPVQAPWVIRATIGRLARRSILVRGKMMEGLPLPQKYLPKPGLDARAEAEALRAALYLFAAHGGPYAMNPIMGRITPEEWARVHCVHCAHHLSFARPVEGGPHA